MGLLGRLLQFLFGRPQPKAPEIQPRRATPPARPEDAPVVVPSPPVVAPVAEGEPPAPAPTPAAAEPLAPVAGPPPEATQDPYFSAQAAKVPAARKEGELGLDADDFLPITRKEIKAEAKGMNLFANAWFGRRDLIPPADDPRTRLIDRALVTNGLLSPEELAEIHQAGIEHDWLSPALSAVEAEAVLQGEAAILADREARERLKARKKAEAAERKRAREEAISRDFATDIRFLGRGVSAKLGDRTSNVELLQSKGLPVISTPAELAEALALTIPRLRWLAFHNEVATRTHYVQFSVPKRSGGTRTLSAPHKSLAVAQRRVLLEILNKLPVEPCAHGFISGRGIVSNASEHAGRGLVVNMDLQDFFPSIGFPRVRKLFETLGYSPAVATILALLCTECPRRLVQYEGQPYHVATGPRGLPQGACTSPSLSNQVARRLDRRLTGLAGRLGLSYTRYADDLSFSGDTELKPKVGYLMARIRHIAQDEGFAVNEAKSRVLGRNSAQTVTGLVVNERPGVPRDEIRRIRAILHKARTEGLDQQNREGRDNYLAWLRGKIAYISMSRPEVGQRFKDELQALLQKP